MSTLWLVPLVVTLVGMTAVVIAVRLAAEEAGRLRHELRAMAGLRPLLAEVHVAARAVRLPQVRGRHH